MLVVRIDPDLGTVTVSITLNGSCVAECTKTLQDQNNFSRNDESFSVSLPDKASKLLALVERDWRVKEAYRVLIRHGQWLYQSLSESDRLERKTNHRIPSGDYIEVDVIRLPSVVSDRDDYIVALTYKCGDIASTIVVNLGDEKKAIFEMIGVSYTNTVCMPFPQHLRCGEFDSLCRYFWRVAQGRL